MFRLCVCVFIVLFCLTSAQDEGVSIATTAKEPVEGTTSPASATMSSLASSLPSSTSSTSPSPSLPSPSSSSPLLSSTENTSSIKASALATSTEAMRKVKKYLTADDIPACTLQSDNSSACIVNILQTMQKRFKDGNADFDIPAIDPFILNRTIFRYKNGGVSGRILMRNALVYGFSNTQYKSVDLKVDKDKMSIKMQSIVPQVEVVGSYKAEMGFNNVRIRPRGNFKISLYNVSISGISEGELYEKDSHRFIRFTNFDAEPKVGDFKFAATGIFPDPTLNEVVSNIINEYWREIFRVFLPETRRYWAPLVLRFVNDALSVAPFDAFIKE